MKRNESNEKQNSFQKNAVKKGQGKSNLLEEFAEELEFSKSQKNKTQNEQSKNN